MIDLCKIFGVEEGEEFKIEGGGYNTTRTTYKIWDNKLFFKNSDFSDTLEFKKSTLKINDLRDITNIIKLPKKKEFTDDELCILRNMDKEYKWITRTRGDVITLHDEKPFKDHDIWNSRTIEKELNVFNHLFNSIQWEDEEPVFIDDYVERGAE
jgi:hypothetical protein